MSGWGKAIFEKESLRNQSNAILPKLDIVAGWILPSSEKPDDLSLFGAIFLLGCANSSMIEKWLKDENY